MKLICMAHMGEAQTFIKELNLKSTSGSFYKNDDIGLLITGEGPYEVLTKLPYIVAKFSPTKIINFGIAGSLTKKLKIGDIHSIRTLYGFGDTEPKFHTYTCESDSLIDCVTSEKRVLDDDYATKLSHFAEIVDREVWAIGRVCKQYKIPLESYKLISDYAGSTTHCFDLKEKAMEFSQTMYNYYKEVFHLKNERHLGDNKSEINFNTSFTHGKKINTLATKLDMSIDQVNQLYQKISIDYKKNSQKEHVKILVSSLEKMLNPINDLIDTKVNKLTRPLEKIGAKLIFNPNSDTKMIHLKMDINHQTNIDNLASTLKDLDFSHFEDIWNGNLDV